MLATIIPASAQSAAAPPGLEAFLYALGQVESGGSYTARNASSGAYGKYQIIPSSWAAWAKSYLGSSTAPKTPENQEIVAHRKVTALYNWLGTWPLVAHWWLTGSSERDSSQWSSFSRTYVARVIALMKSAGDATSASVRLPSRTASAASTAHVGETSRSIAYTGSWPTARYASYAGHRVKYATRKGATATLTFTGRTVSWVGPVGPTRGTARVFVDGKAAGTVNLRRSAFHARATLFSFRFPTAGKHTLEIVVTSSGRPVAIDELLVRS